MDNHTLGALLLVLLVVFSEVRIQVYRSKMKKGQAVKTVRF